MIGKLLLTLLVIALVVVYLRKQHQVRQRRSTQNGAGSDTRSGMPARQSDRGELEQFLSRARRGESGTASDAAHNPGLVPRIKTILGALLLLLLLAGGIGSYLYWQDQQRLVTVLLHRNASEAPVIYRVAKRNLGVNSFTTENGTVVTISANERMEVVGL